MPETAPSSLAPCVQFARGMQARALARRALKSATASVFHYSGLRKALGAVRRARSGGRRVLIVAYHRVVDDFTGELRRSIPGTLISRETLRRHFEAAAAAGYEFASLSDALDVLSGRRAARRDLLVVTFDDGYRDVYRHAFPILARMGVPALVYLPTDYVGTSRRFVHDRLFALAMIARERRTRPLYALLPHNAALLLEPVFSQTHSLSQSLDGLIAQSPAEELEALAQGLAAQLDVPNGLDEDHADVMSWDEARRMRAAGIAMGAHTRTHRVLTLASPQVVEDEIRGSRDAIVQHLGVAVRDFAYCNGWYSQALISTLKRLGFRSAVTTEDWPNHTGIDPYVLRRKVLWENFSTGLFGDYSESLTACQLDDVFGALGMTQPVLGRHEPLPGSQLGVG